MEDPLTYNIISQRPLTAREPTISQHGSPKQIIPQLPSKNRQHLPLSTSWLSNIDREISLL